MYDELCKGKVRQEKIRIKNSEEIITENQNEMTRNKECQMLEVFITTIETRTQPEQNQNIVKV